MTKVRVNAFSVSLDGFAAAPNQSLANPFGEGGMVLPAWLIKTRTFQQMFGNGGGKTGPDDDFAARAAQNLGAWVIGRNMFSPLRGPWPDESWRGWWGENPPYHTDVFVLTHHPRPTLTMEGGTVFHFVTDGAAKALERAKAAAGGKDVRIGGGTATIRQYLQASAIDEMHFAVAPVLLGRGENLFAGLDLPALGYAVQSSTPTANATHVIIGRG